MKITCMDTQYIFSLLINSARLRDSDKEYGHGFPFVRDKYYM